MYSNDLPISHKVKLAVSRHKEGLPPDIGASSRSANTSHAFVSVALAAEPSGSLVREARRRHVANYLDLDLTVPSGGNYIRSHPAVL
jgi:hypothetical protein